MLTFRRIMMSRTMCYGECPVYEVQILNTGEVTYQGIDFVAELGERHWKISPKRVQKLADLVEWIDYRNFRYETSELIATDHPSCLTAVEFMDGQICEVDHYCGDLLASDDLVRFENQIDTLAGTRKYVRPTMYIYRIEYQGQENLHHRDYIVVARNVKQARELANTRAFENTALDREQWTIVKLGRETQGSYIPYVVFPKMRGQS